MKKAVSSWSDIAKNHELNKIEIEQMKQAFKTIGYSGFWEFYQNNTLINNDIVSFFVHR